MSTKANSNSSTPKTSPAQTGSLFVCATPIGHLADCSFRLIDTLKSVDLIAAEDTRVTTKLLTHYKISTPLISLQKYNEAARIHTLLTKLKSGQNIALVSDAGTPNICDPGSHLIAQLHEYQVPIVLIPGPSAVTAAISISGILANRFFFGGFIPRKKTELIELLNQTRQLECPIVLFESGKRILATLTVLEELDTTCQIALFKELTKYYETHLIGNPKTVLDQLQNIQIKGEWVLILKQSSKKSDHPNEKITRLKEQQFSPSQVRWICQNLLGIPRNDAYTISQS